MGNEPPKQTYQPKLEKQKLEIACIKVSGHLEIQVGRRQNQGAQKEKQLVQMINAPQRSKVEELHKASSIVSDMMYIQGCGIVIRFCGIIKDRSLLICQSVGNPQNIEELLPFIESVIWSSRYLNLNAMQEFNGLILSFFGAQGIDVTSSPKVDPELKKCFETVMPTPQDINDYMIKLSIKSQISLDRINEVGHNFSDKPIQPPQPPNNGNGEQQQFNQPPQQQQQQQQFQPQIGGYYPNQQQGQGGQGQVINVNVQLPSSFGQNQNQYQYQQQQQPNQFNQPPNQFGQQNQFQQQQPNQNYQYQPQQNQFQYNNQPINNNYPQMSIGQNQFNNQQPNQFQQQPQQNQFSNPQQQHQDLSDITVKTNQTVISNPYSDNQFNQNNQQPQQFNNQQQPQQFNNQQSQQQPQQISKPPEQKPQQFQQAPQYQKQPNNNPDLDSLEERLKRLRDGV